MTQKRRTVEQVLVVDIQWWIHILLMIGCAIMGVWAMATFTGCTVTKPPVATPPMLVSSVATAPMPAPIVEPEEPVVEEAPQDPDIVKVLQKYEKTKVFTHITTPAVKKYAFDPTEIYELSCPEWGVLTIRLAPGEVLKKVSVGNPYEWKLDPDTTIRVGDLDAALITLRRTPFAAPAQMTAYTDINIYEFVLKPGGPLGKGRTRQTWFWNPEAEQQRFREKAAYAKAREERRKRAEANRLPQLSPEHARNYEVGGDAVVWRPLRVTGDHQRTLLFLPAATGTEHPTLRVLQDGVETSTNARTVPGRDGNGPTIVVDQAFSRAVLKGEGGVVKIEERGN